MRVRKKQPLRFRSMEEAKPDEWGRCDSCRGRFQGCRVKLTHSSGKIAYLCLGCSQAFMHMVKGGPVVK